TSRGKHIKLRAAEDREKRRSEAGRGDERRGDAGSREGEGDEANERGREWATAGGGDRELAALTPKISSPRLLRVCRIMSLDLCMELKSDARGTTRKLQDGDFSGACGRSSARG